MQIKDSGNCSSTNVVYHLDAISVTVLINVNMLLPQPCPTPCTLCMMTMTKRNDCDWFKVYVEVINIRPYLISSLIFVFELILV